MLNIGTPQEAVAHLLAPVTPEEFCARYLEREPLHVAREVKDHYACWLTLQAWLDVLASHSPEIVELKVSRESDVAANITMQQARDAFGEGATLVANALQKVYGPVAGLVRQMELFFWQPFQTNSYLTPPGNRGFNAHFDLHDVFIVQVHGAKRWRVYTPEVELPLREQNKLIKLDPGTRPMMEVELQAGHLLYLPRGYIHEGDSVGNDISLHLSLGMVGFTWRDALVHVIDRLALEQRELRRYVPMGDGEAFARELAEVLAMVAPELQRRAFTSAQQAFVQSRPAVLPQLRLNGPSLSQESRLRRHPLVAVCTRPVPDAVAVLFHGKGIELPKAAEPALRFMLDRTEPFAVHQVPGLDAVNRLRLAAHLHQQGLLERLD
ncbi:MAG: cupin domain-containing protein [Candidatus Xenobia bacterium]